MKKTTIYFVVFLIISNFVIIKNFPNLNFPIKDITFSIIGKNDKGEVYDLTLDSNDSSPKKITPGHNELK